MTTNNNYHPRPPLPDIFSTIFWGIVLIGFIAFCINKICDLL